MIVDSYYWLYWLVSWLVGMPSYVTSMQVREEGKVADWLVGWLPTSWHFNGGGGHLTPTRLLQPPTHLVVSRLSSISARLLMMDSTSRSYASSMREAASFSWVRGRLGGGGQGKGRGGGDKDA